MALLRVAASACRIVRTHWAFAPRRVLVAVARPYSNSNSTTMLFSKASRPPSLLMPSNLGNSLTLTRGRQFGATCRTRLLHIPYIIMQHHLLRLVSSRRRLRHLPSTTPWVTARRRFSESTTGTASLRPAFNRRCQPSRHLASRLLRKSIQIYPNKPAPSCKITISPIVPYRRLLILHRGRRAVEDIHPPSLRRTKHYICTNDTWHTSSSDRILTYVCQMLWTCHTPVLPHFCTTVPSYTTINIYFKLIFFVSSAPDINIHIYTDDILHPSHISTCAFHSSHFPHGCHLLLFFILPHLPVPVSTGLAFMTCCLVSTLVSPSGFALQLLPNPIHSVYYYCL